MIQRILSLGALALFLACPLVAQDDDAKFNESQAKKINAFADKAFKKGFPRAARLEWLKVLKLYDFDNAVARDKLGFDKSGRVWVARPNFKYPLEDTGESKDGRSLFSAYEKLKKQLAAAHKSEAKKWAKAERRDKELFHYGMVLRWVRDDTEAQNALEHQEVGGVTGTGLEQTLYDRSKMIEKVVAEQAKVQYGVEKVEKECAVLKRAQVPYISVKSEHFLLHGDEAELENLKEALQWAERARVVCAEAFPWQVNVTGEYAFFTSKDTYKQILKAHADKIPNLEWALEHTSTRTLDNIRVGATGGAQTLFDACVRNVARGHSGFIRPGLGEGIGHTFVGMIFNNNRLFSVDTKKQEGTTTTEEDNEYTSPDFDVWKNLALEMAWTMTGGIAASEIPFVEVGSFTNEERIKCWSFCDYVMRRDPNLLRQLDRAGLEDLAQKDRPRSLGQRKQRGEQLDAAYSKKVGVSIAQLDKEWEDFWTEATPVLAAIRNNTPPLASVSKGVEKWLKALNAARTKLGATECNWSSNLSARCKEHAEYLKTNKKERGPAAEHRQLVDLGGTHLGNMFAQMAVVETGAKVGKAKKIFERWMTIPGYRDALINHTLRTVGIYTDGDIFVMNVISGIGTPRSKKSGYSPYPRNAARGVPTEAKVADLGPELVELLEKHGKGKKKTVGFPLTIHFGGTQIPGDKHSYKCRARSGRGEPIEGAILFDDGKIRNTSSPGLITFIPFEPLPRGEVEVTWTWKLDSGDKSLKTKFTTK